MAQEDARDIKEQLLRLGAEQKNRQTTKILNDFEVGAAGCKMGVCGEG